MKIPIPSKKVCERFHLTYELKGAQKGVDVLTRCYKIRRMKTILDGRRVANGYVCQYWKNKAYFTKKGFTRRNVLHELYHHLVEVKGIEMPEKKEERLANAFAKEVVRKLRDFQGILSIFSQQFL